MNNKVLIKITVPELDVSYDVFIPVNELVWKIKMLLLKSIGDLQKTHIDYNREYYLFDKRSCQIYNNNEIVLNTNIRNGSELLLVSSQK